MKIICVNNFDRESINDRLIAENVPAFYANFLCEKLNECYSSSYSGNYFRVEPDDYKLHIYDPR